MRNATVVVAVLAVVAMAAPAFGTTYWSAGDATWHDDGNWSGSQPTSSDTACVQNGGTANITGTANADTLWISSGSDDTGTVLQSGSSSVATFASYLAITDNATAVGLYGISDGSLSVGADLLMGSNNGGDGRFRITGSNSSINVSDDFSVYTGATWEIVLDAAGVTKVVAHSNNAYADALDPFGGALLLDASAYSVTGTHTIDILQCTAELHDYSNLTLDAASVAAGWSLTHTGNNDGTGAGTLQLTVPEPATMVLLGIGGIGVLIRRRRK